VGSLTLNPDEFGIDFSATAFSGTGTPDWGISTLEATAQVFEVGRTKLAKKDFVVFAAGGPGTLVDNGDGTGHWTIIGPVRVEYDGETAAETVATLTTDASYSYYDENDHLQSVNGVTMDYATGDAVLVAQVELTEGILQGYRATLAINANDPVLVSAAAPVPSISFGGLALLAGLVLSIVGWARRGN